MNGQLSVPIAARAAAPPSVAAGLLWVAAWAYLLMTHVVRAAQPGDR